MTTLHVNDIRRDGGTQPRAQLDGVTVSEYADAMERGNTFPPVKVMHDGDNYWLYDGFHRVQAAEQIGREEVEAEVEQGTKQDAQWASLAANKQHGLRRSQKDKRRAIKRALKGWGEDKSQRAIAQHVGVSPDTVSRWEKKICPNRTDKREVTRGGTTYTQDTSNIGGQSSDTGNTSDTSGEEQGDTSATPGWPHPDAEYHPDDGGKPSEIYKALQAGTEYYCKYCYKTHSAWRAGRDYDREVWECEVCDHATPAKHMRSGQKSLPTKPSGDGSPSKPSRSEPPTSSTSSAPSTTKPTRTKPDRSTGTDDADPDLTPPKPESDDPLTTEDIVKQVCQHIAQIDISTGAIDAAKFMKELDKFTDDQRERVAAQLRSTADRLATRADKIDPS